MRQQCPNTRFSVVTPLINKKAQEALLEIFGIKIPPSGTRGIIWLSEKTWKQMVLRYCLYNIERRDLCLFSEEHRYLYYLSRFVCLELRLGSEDYFLREFCMFPF